MRRNPIVQLLLVRLRIFRREPEALFWTFGFPLVVILVLGIAFRPTDPEPLPIAIVRGGEADAIARTLRADEELAIQRASGEEADRAFRAGRAHLVVERDGRLRYDPTRTGVVGMPWMIGSAAMSVSSFARRLSRSASSVAICC